MKSSIAVKQFLKEKEIDFNGKFFVSFIEEAIMNSEYEDYVGGRVEIWNDNYEFDIVEIRFFTKNPSFYEFRNKWDFKNVNTKQLDFIEKTIKDKYQQYEPI
jgi:hypothetical protein